jgi:hypothetical protein
MDNLLVKAADTGKRLSHTLFELLTHSIIFSLMLLKPSPIVIGHYLTEKSEYSFYIHCDAKIDIFPLTTK